MYCGDGLPRDSATQPARHRDSHACRDALHTSPLGGQDAHNGGGGSPHVPEQPNLLRRPSRHFQHCRQQAEIVGFSVPAHVQHLCGEDRRHPVPNAAGGRRGEEEFQRVFPAAQHRESDGVFAGGVRGRRRVLAVQGGGRRERAADGAVERIRHGGGGRDDERGGEEEEGGHVEVRVGGVGDQ